MNSKWLVTHGIGHNHTNISINVKDGSGGAGLLTENTFSSNYNIQVLDKSHEGILWINFKHKWNLLQPVCVLPAT